jgi:urease accessory protein
MHFPSSKISRAGTAVALTLAASVAQAHTGHGTSGVAEGLAHPLGADHLLAMLAVGIWSVSALPANKAWWGPATFMLSLLLSAVLGAAGLSFSGLEQMITLSVVIIGGMLVVSRIKIPVALGLGLVALAASMHGLAHGAETPETGFEAYATGFLATTAMLHFGGVATGLTLRKVLADKANWALAGLGGLFSGIGVYLLNQI